RKVNRFRVIPKSLLQKRAEGHTGFWTTLSQSIMRHPWAYLITATAVMVALALPALTLHVTGGDNRGVPLTTESTKGFKLLEDSLGAGALAPNQIVVDTGQRGGAFQPATIAAECRLIASLRQDPEIQPQTIQAPVRPGACVGGAAGPPTDAEIA